MSMLCHVLVSNTLLARLLSEAMGPKVSTQDKDLELDPDSLEEITGESKNAKRNRSRVKKRLLTWRKH